MKLHSKQDFTELMFSILNPLKDKYSEKCAFLDVGSSFAWYEVISSRMEAFARPLWGLVPFWSAGGSDADFDRIYINGIISGTDPKSSEFWGDCHDFDQRFVEMASLAYGLLLAPEKTWYPLSDDQKNNFAAWLYSINEHTMPDNNWRFFRVLVNIALKKHCMPYSAEQLDTDLERIDSFYLGDGWYRDGIKGQKDYYVAFAIHFYGLIYAKIMENDDRERSEKFKARSMKFAKDFIYWFADDGAAVPYGRSLTYRFAQISFWSACLIAGIRPFPVGVMKGIIVRNLKYWLSDNRIFDNGHILTIGYKYNQPAMSENYNSPGSPYWSMKAFAFMALPENHEFWTVDALPMPELKSILKQEKSDMLIARYNGSVTMYPTGTLEDFGCGLVRYKYLKLAYSSKFGFSTPKSSWSFQEGAPDSTLSFEIDERIVTRIRSNNSSISDDKLVTSWSPLKGIEVETEIIPTDFGHIRNHTVTSNIDCTAYDSGFAVSCMDNDNCIRTTAPGEATAKNDFSFCTVKSETGEASVKEVVPNTNLISPKTVIPTVKYDIKNGINKFTTYIYEI